MLLAQPTPPAPPTPPGVPRIVIGGTEATPQSVYAAAKARGEELSNQLERLEDRRNDLSERLQQVTDDVDRKGVQQQITELDGRIQSVNVQIAAADQEIAQAAGIPGAIPPEQPEPRNVGRNGPPEVFFAIPIVFILFVLFPMAIAYSRRIWRRSAGLTGGNLVVPAELTERIERIETAVESVAVEVERIGEGQRFVTKLLGDTQLRAQVEAPR